MADNTQKLLLQIDASTELLRRNLARGDGDVAKFERETNRRIDNIDRNFAGLGKGIGGLTGKFNGLKGAAAAVGVGFSIAGIAAAITKGLEYASSLGEVSQQLGVTTKDLQVYRYAASQVGIEQEVMDRSLAKLTQNLGKAATGGKAQGKVFSALGIDVRNAGGDIKTAGEILPAIADALAAIPSPAQRAAVEVALFGKVGQQLDTLLSGGSGRINNLAEAAKNLGLILSNEQIARADETADKLSELKQVLEARIAAAVSDNASSIVSLADSLVGLVVNAGKATRALRLLYLELKAANAEDNAAIPAFLTGNDYRMKNLQTAQEARDEIQRLTKEGTPDPKALGRMWTPSLYADRPVPGGPIDVDELNAAGGGAGRETRTDAQRLAAFKSELLKRGARVTDDVRTYAEQERLYRLDPNGAARPGTSEHEVSRGIDVGKETSDAVIRAAARAARVDIKDPLTHGTKLGRHKHIGIKGDGDGNSGDGEDQLERLAKEELEARKAKLRDDFQNASAERSGQAEILRAQQGLLTDYVARNAIADQLIDLETKQELAAVDLDVSLGEIDATVAAQKRARIGILDGLKKQAVAADQEASRVEEYNRLEDARAAILIQSLEDEVASATTASERRKAELRLLDAVRALERAKLQAVLDDQAATENQKAEARRQIEAADKRRPGEETEIRRGTRGPIEEMRSRIPETAAEINEALESVAAQGLGSLTDGITEAIMGTKSLGEVFKSVANQIIADLIRIAVQRAIIGPLTDAVFGKAEGSSGGSRGSGIVSSLTKLLGSFSKSGRLGASINATAVSNYARLPGRASGGPVNRGDPYMVGERGRELFIPSVSGKIVSNDNLRRGGGHTTVQQTFHVNAAGAVLASGLVAEMQAVGVKAVVGGASLAQGRMAQRSSQKLGRAW